MREFHVFIQARMSSTRLPGKALEDLDGDPLTRFMLKRLDHLDPIVLCPDEDAEVLRRELDPWQVLSGPRDDVLARFKIAAVWNPAKFYVRLTGDCPLVDPQWIAWYLNVAIAGNYPYYGVVNAPDGNDIEVIRADTLDVIQGPDEHVTTGVSKIAGAVRITGSGQPKYSVDTKTDLERVRKIVAALGRECTKDQILSYLKENA